MYGAAAIYGATTRAILARSAAPVMGLIGLLVASVLNLFLHSSQGRWLISIVGVVIFTG